MVIDHQVDVMQQPRKVMRLDVNQRNLVERLELIRRDGLDLQIQQLHHPQVFGTRHALQAANNRRLLGSAQDGA